MADTLGSVGVIISTLLINQFGWTGFDPLASIFIAVLIFASVVPLVMDAGQLLVLDMGEEREVEVKKALAQVRALYFPSISIVKLTHLIPLDICSDLFDRRCRLFLRGEILGERSSDDDRISTYSIVALDERGRTISFRERRPSDETSTAGTATWYWRTERSVHSGRTE